ncbi:MAG: hypothetical protein HZA31_01815 [Opitutae bacterium]|nr:hypothetical protein [Opitutae bacterium]
MTAIEVIDQIKTMSPEERAKVVGFIREIEAAQPPGVRHADEKTFAQAAQWVLGEHTDLLRKLAQ